MENFKSCQYVFSYMFLGHLKQIPLKSILWNFHFMDIAFFFTKDVSYFASISLFSSD